MPAGFKVNGFTEFNHHDRVAVGEEAGRCTHWKSGVPKKVRVKLILWFFKETDVGSNGVQAPKKGVFAWLIKLI